MSEVEKDNAANTDASEIVNDTEGQSANETDKAETSNTNHQEDKPQVTPIDSAAKHDENHQSSDAKPGTEDAGDLQSTIQNKDTESFKDDAANKKSNAEDNSESSTTDKENIKVNEEKQMPQTDLKAPAIEESKQEKSQSVGTSTSPVTETPEVSSTVNDEKRRKPSRGSRRPSYQRDRYSGFDGYGYQNYGLAHLPYKSNFEPSENARRKAEEFFKTLKL